MDIPNVFSGKIPEKDCLLEIEGEEARHLKVLRLQKEGFVRIVDGKGVKALGKIKELSKNKALVSILKKDKVPVELPMVSVAVAVPKGQHMDFLLQKASELNLYEIIPTVFERSVIRFIGAEKAKRWQRVCIEGAKQSGNAYATEVRAMTGFDKVIGLEAECKILLDPYAGKTLKQALPERAPKTVLFIIGPEGDLTDKEKEKAEEKGFIKANIGKSLLRTETALVVSGAMVKYKYNL